MADYIDENWPDLAAFAYDCFLRQGRGVVVIAGMDWKYSTDLASLSCCSSDRSKLIAWKEHYRPQREALFALHTENIATIHIREGSSIWTPPILMTLKKQGQWEETLARWRGEPASTAGEETRQRKSFHRYKKR